MRNNQSGAGLPAARFCVAQVLLFVFVLLLSACGLEGSSDAEYLTKAKGYLANSDAGAAVIELKSLLKQSPESAEARFLLGKHYVSVNNGKGAAKELRLAKRYGRANDETELLFLKALLLQEKYEDVLLGLAKVNVEPGEMFEGFSALQAEALLGMDKIDEAKETVNAALRTLPQSVSLLVAKAVIDIADDQDESAYQTIKKAAGQNPDDTRVWRVKGDLDFRHKRYAEAQAAYQTILASKAVGPYSNERINANLGLAKVKIAQKDFAGAKSTVDDVLKVSPHHPIANHLLASISYEQKDYPEALRFIQKTLKVVPRYPAGNQLAGVAYYQMGLEEQAVQALELALHGDPDSLMSRKLLAAVNLSLNQPEKAAEILAPAMEGDVKDAILLAMVAEAALKSGDSEKGKQYLRRAQESDPNSSAIRTGLAFAYLSGGESDRAISELNHSIAMDSKDVQSRIMLAATYMRERKTDEAREVLLALRRDFPRSPEPLNELGKLSALEGKEKEARDYFQQSLAKDAYFIPTMMSVARLELMVGNPAAAKVIYEKVLSRKPGEKNALVSLAEINLRSGNKKQAVAGLEKARNLHPQFIVPRIILARVYLQERSVLKARAVVSEAVRIDAENLDVQELQGMVLLASGKADKALNIIGKLVKRSPTAAHYYQLAQAQRILNKPKDAILSLTKGLKKNPQHMSSLTLAAFIHHEMGESRKAVAVYKKIIEQQPKNVFVLNNMAMLMLDVDKNKAVGYAQKAYQIDTSAPYADTLGWVLLKSGDLQQGLGYLKKAHDAAASNVSISYHLAVALVESGEKLDAQQLLEDVINSGQMFHELDDAKRLLASLK